MAQDADLHTETTEVPAEHHAKPGLPQLDPTSFASQIFWLVVSFILLYVVISRVAAPKIDGVLSLRAGRIKSDLDQAADAQRASEAAIANYEKALAEARGRALKMSDEIRRTVKAEAEAKNAAATKQLNADLALAEKRIAEMRSNAMARVGDVAKDTAADIIAKLIGERASDGELDTAVRGALKG